jgi:hypothetical protein
VIDNILRSLLGPAVILSPGEALLLLIGGVAFLLALVTAVLAGSAVAMRARKNARTRGNAARFQQWQQALHGVLYDGVERSTLWALVSERTALDFLHFLVEFVRRLQGSERAEICVLAEPYLVHLLPYLSHRSESRRARAVQMLGELGLPRHGSEVIASLDDPSPMVAMVAASTLASSHTPEYAAAVLTRLERFAHWRQDFLAAMVASMGDDASSALRAKLADPDASPKARSVAADALAMSSDPLAADLAWELVKYADDRELRAASLRVLSSVGRAKHLDAVRACLDSPELGVRLAAIRALGHFGLESDLGPLEDAARQDPSPWVAIAAARALKAAGGHAALETLAGSNHPRAALGLQVMSESRSW